MERSSEGRGVHTNGSRPPIRDLPARHANIATSIQLILHGQRSLIMYNISQMPQRMRCVVGQCGMSSMLHLARAWRE